MYVTLGRAFDQARMTDSAVTMLERYVTTPSWMRPGVRANAASYFAKFVELWKDADPELQPKVREARARLVRLGDTERD